MLLTIRDKEGLEGVQRRVKELENDQEHNSSVEWLREPEVLSLDKRRLGGIFLFSTRP